MFEKIISCARTTEFDFRDYACPDDPLTYRFDEWVSHYKMKWAISHLVKPKSILEIGVRFGYAAVAFLHGNPAARYVGLDLDTDSYGGSKGAINWAKKICRQFSADFVIADSQTMDRLPGGSYDLVHVDGQQDGDGTFHDLELAIKQARYVLIDGYVWTQINFTSINEFLFRHLDFFDFYGVIPGYSGELLLKVSDDAPKARSNGRPLLTSSFETRPAYTSEYYLRHCEGFDSYKECGAKVLAEPRLQAIASIASLYDKGRVLDIGCGRGELVFHLAQRGFSVTAVDYSPDAIALAKKSLEGEEELKARVEFRQSDICGIDLQGKYDLVIASDVIERLSHAEVYFLYQEISKHLGPNGLFVIHTRPNLWYYKYEYPKIRRTAASVGAYLPPQPRSTYELLMNINEQSPRVLKRQLTSRFQHVRVWFGDPTNPAGSLLENYNKSRLRQTRDLYAIASDSPINDEQLRDLFHTKVLPPLNSGEIRVAIKECPVSVPKRSVFTLLVELENESSFVLVSSPPYPVHMAYHWIDETTSETIMFDGKRSALFPPLGPGSTASYTVKVETPKRPGSYVLRTTLVQEGVRWLDEAPTLAFADARVRLS
jgi:2-polyprenyl-3-methyl-5-hydroxy-6-metoxy-1,4-benzoquinol methylase